MGYMAEKNNNKAMFSQKKPLKSSKIHLGGLKPKFDRCCLNKTP